ncbi:MAG: hypothetical protein C0525_03050 [Flavobacterium sp.]|jgi:uncharacterized membrane protein YgdD (TMEM256/DUF423 family)|uniref:Brp/Blh family beta-carotene 15,15'-monooxygenase n=1 Tax=Flavobacterium cheonhonense TaxID=706185 RepID=A0ABP7TIB8_9FLAO|nr:MULTISPECIES: hypothetical protein [Flavobacterium]MBA4133682.1 hypothetical protein [Flavobacterium sp.]
MEAKDYLKDIQDIKQMMAQSTQFISLSGLSGILAGLYALCGAVVVNFLIDNHHAEFITLESTTFKQIIAVAIVVLVLSLVTAYFLTAKKAKKVGEKVWNPSSKRLLINFCIPLFTGGILALLLLRHGVYGLIAPITLIFYGLACVNASKYTLRDVRYLGITEIILGLIAVEYSGYGLYVWIVGFGICHIVYGAVMYYKYDRN